MTLQKITQLLLTILATALTTLAVDHLARPKAVSAQPSGNEDPFYVEPGVYMLRVPTGGQVLGKVMINLRTGSVWGFPTTSNDPYPMSPIENKQQVSHPIPLGRFAIAETAGR